MAFLRQLHKRMFDRTWKWAGKIRKTNKNIAVLELLADVTYQTEHKTFPSDEIALRFHHRLVSIHLFPNGNGRHARLAADLFIRSLGRPQFSWGGTDLSGASETRKRYIEALKAADRGEYQDLLSLARSGRLLDSTR